MALPAWTNGVILRNRGQRQLIIDDLGVGQFNVGRLNLEGAVKTNINFLFADNLAVNTISHSNNELTFQDCVMLSSLQIGEVALRKNLNVNTFLTCAGLTSDKVDIQTLGIFGNKINPVEPDPGRNEISMLGSQNKLFFKYFFEDDESTLIITNPLLKSGMAFLKDITGVNDIPGVTITYFPDATSIVISNFESIPGGFSQGMILII